MMAASDSRYKTNINSLANSLAILNQLRGTSYLLKDKEVATDEQFGFIAQEVESILPNLVMTDQEGYKAVNYIGLIPVLTEGIKAQQDLIEQQGNRIDTQEKEIDQQKETIKAQAEEMAILKNRLAKIEAALGLEK